MRTCFHFLLLAALALSTGCEGDPHESSADGLPHTVHRSVRAVAPQGEIEGFSLRNDNGTTIYDVDIRIGGGLPKRVSVESSGRIVAADPTLRASPLQRRLAPTGEKEIPFSALPEPVRSAVLTNAPVAEVERITLREHTDGTVYRVHVVGQYDKRVLELDENGVLLNPPGAK
jgi:hypothetical protein